MPKVIKKTKSARGSAYSCVACPDKIVAGQEYYQWTFFKTRPRRQHASHGLPKRSQLTQSNMAEAYAAEEGLSTDLANAKTVQDVKDALESCKGAIESAKDQYEEGYNNMPEGLQNSSTGEESQRKIDLLQEYVDALDNAVSSIDDFDEDEPELDDPEHEEWERKQQEAVDAAKETAQEPTLED